METMIYQCIIICAVHCDYSQPHTTNAHNSYKIIYHPYTGNVLHVSAIYRHHQGDKTPTHTQPTPPKRHMKPT